MTYDNIIFVGDIHQNIKLILKFIKEYDISNSLFYVCGDFGIGFDTKRKEVGRLRHYDASFKSKNNKLIAIRGNHDNPEYFQNNFKYGSIECLPDYSVITANDINILGIGGAISVDRLPNSDMYDNYTKKPWKGRKEGLNYWSGEIVNYNEEKLIKLSGIDVVVTHDSPDFCFPELYMGIEKWMKSDFNLKEEVIKNRSVLTKIYDKLSEKNDIKYWFYGHFHMYNFSEINGTRFILLDIGMCYNLDERHFNK
jgi:predicted phosphodiesterase